LRIVNLLIHQIGGRLELDSRSGTAFKITFRA
jgi:two-component sensor histidine kinase